MENGTPHKTHGTTETALMEHGRNKKMGRTNPFVIKNKKNILMGYCVIFLVLSGLFF